MNWHILLAWGCPLGLAVLLLVMTRLSERERVEGGGCHKAAKGGGGKGRGLQASTVLQEKKVGKIKHRDIAAAISFREKINLFISLLL